MASLQQGSIVWAYVACRYTGERKRRPAIIATRTDEIESTDIFTAVAASHSATNDPKPWPDTYVSLPFHPKGTVSTKLKKETVALTDWTFELHEDDIDEFIGGFVKSALLETILIKSGLVEPPADA